MSGPERMSLSDEQTAERLRVHGEIAKSLPPGNTETQRYGTALDRIAELEATRRAWVRGDDPMCEDVCLVECKGPCVGERRETES